MNQPESAGARRASSKRPIQLILASGASGLAVGLGTNTLAADTGYRAAAGAAAVAAVVSSTWWLRQLPQRAPLVRMASWVLLSTAALAAVLAVALPARWQGWASIAADPVGIPGRIVLAARAGQLDHLGRHQLAEHLRAGDETVGAGRRYGLTTR